MAGIDLFTYLKDLRRGSVGATSCFLDRDVSEDVKKISEATDLDLSDAFHHLTLEAGLFSVLVGGSGSQC